MRIDGYFADIEARDTADLFGERQSLGRVGQADQQRNRNLLDMRHRENAQPAYLDPTGNRVWWRRDQVAAGALKQGVIVADQLSTAIDQAQCEVGLAGARFALDQYRAPVDGDAGDMKRFE